MLVGQTKFYGAIDSKPGLAYPNRPALWTWSIFWWVSRSKSNTGNIYSRRDPLRCILCLIFDSRATLRCIVGSLPLLTPSDVDTALSSIL